jgi:hypothetical protein
MRPLIFPERTVSNQLPFTFHGEFVLIEKQKSLQKGKLPFGGFILATSGNIFFSLFAP